MVIFRVKKTLLENKTVRWQGQGMVKGQQWLEVGGYYYLRKAQDA